jgi:plasmid stabilization system protein ParE
MTYSYEFTELVIEDIDATLSYITNILCNKGAATKLMIELQNGIESICKFPFAYPNCNCYFLEDESIRHININNYVLIYKVDKFKIIFLRLRHSKQDKLL